MSSAITAPDFSASPGLHRGAPALDVRQRFACFSCEDQACLRPAAVDSGYHLSFPGSPRFLFGGQLRMGERRENSGANRHCSSDENVPRPGNLRRRRQRVSHSREQRDQLLREDDNRHHDEPNRHSDNRVPLDCPPPQPTKKKSTQQSAVRERSDGECNYNHWRALLLEQQRPARQHDAPCECAELSESQRRRVVGLLAESGM